MAVFYLTTFCFYLYHSNEEDVR